MVENIMEMGYERSQVRTDCWIVPLVVVKIVMLVMVIIVKTLVVVVVIMVRMTFLVFSNYECGNYQGIR